MSKCDKVSHSFLRASRLGVWESSCSRLTSHRWFQKLGEWKIPFQRPVPSVGTSAFLLLLLLKDCGCCFSLVTLAVNMRYSDIEKCCNSSRTKVPSLQVQSCFRDCYRASEVESLIIERLSLWFDFNVGASLTNKCGMQWRNQGRDLWGPAPLIFRRKWGPDGRKHFFWSRAPPYFRVWMTAPLPLIWRSGSATGISMFRTPSCLCATNPPFLHNRAWHSHHKRTCLVSQIGAYLQLMNGTEYLMKNYGNRGGCYPSRPRFP